MGEAGDSIRVTNASGDALYQNLLHVARGLIDRGLSGTIREDIMKSGGLFGTKCPIFIISHPNPPTRFFDIGVLVNDNAVSFVLLGSSVQNTKMNKKNGLAAEGKHLQASLVHPDMLIYQQEQNWQAEVVSALQANFE